MRQPTGTSRRRARANDPSTSTSSSPTYPHPRPPCQTTPSNPQYISHLRTTTAPGTGITGPYTPSCAAWMHHHSPSLTTAMRRAALACGMERDTSNTGTPPDRTLQQLVHDIWTTKEELATLLRPSTREARERDTHLRALLTTPRHQLQEWHAHPIAAAAQERERYGRNDTPYKSLWYVSRILEDTGRRTIHAVRTPEGGLTNDPDALLQALLDSFQARHGDALPDPDSHTRSTIREHVPRVFNREQWRAIEHDPLSISELQRALDRLKTGVVPGVDRLPAEAYQHLTLPIKHRPGARL